jgi:XTP/dITP diphosphohydrolase
MKKTIKFITENKDKFESARSFFEKYNIEIEQKVLPIYEIQSADGIEIAISKAQQAWEIIKEPLFISDSFWEIPSLNGFPGAYMKYMNNWFSPEDFLNLMKDKKDRTIILKSTVVYIDKNKPHIFINDYYGKILTEKYKGDYSYSLDAIVSFSKDGKSIAEENENRNFTEKNSYWLSLAEWLKSKRD